MFYTFSNTLNESDQQDSRSSATDLSSIPSSVANESTEAIEVSPKLPTADDKNVLPDEPTLPEKGNVMIELPDELAATEEKWKKKFYTLQQITKLLDNVFCTKMQLQKFIDEKKKKHEVDFTITEDFSVSKGDFEKKLETDIEQLNKALKQTHSNKNDAEQKSIQLSSELAEQKKQLTEIDEQLATKRALQSKHEKKLTEISNGISKLTEEMNTVQTKIDENTKAMQTCQQSIKNADAILKSNTAKKQKLSDDKSVIENQLKANRQNIQQLDQNTAKIKEELQSTTLQLSELKKEKNKKQKDIDDAKKKHLKCTTTIDNLKAKKNQLGNLEKQITEANEQKSTLQQHLKDNEQKMMLLHKNLNECSKNIKKDEEDILKLEKNIEFQESNDAFILSYRACLNLKIKEIQEKIMQGGYECLKGFCSMWDNQIESLQENLGELSKKVEEHSITSFEPVQVLKGSELSYLQSLDCTIKDIYILRAVIQHCLYQLNFDAVTKSICGSSNGGCEDEHTTGTDHRDVIHLAANAEEQRQRLLHSCKDINSNFLKLNNTRFGDEKSLLAYILEQGNFWNEIQQLLKLLTQSLVAIERKFGSKEIDVVFCHNYEANKSASMDVCIDEEEFKKAVNLLNEVHCFQNLISVVDSQLAILYKDNEELAKSKYLTTLENDLLNTQTKLECKESEIHQLEVEKQQVQQNLDNTQKRIEELNFTNQKLQKEIQNKELYLDELSQMLSYLQQDLQLKQSEISDIAAKKLQIKELQVKINRFNVEVTDHHKYLEDLEHKLKELQLGFQKHEVDNVDYSIKTKVITKAISETQRKIQTKENNIKLSEKELAQLDETVRKEPELLKSTAALQKDIMGHESKICDTKISISESQSKLNSNASILEKCKIEEENQKAKIVSISCKLDKKNAECTQILWAYAQCIVKIAIHKAVIDYQIEINKQKIKELHQSKSSLVHKSTGDSEEIIRKQSEFKQQLYSFNFMLQQSKENLKAQQDKLKIVQEDIQKIKNDNSDISSKLRHTDAEIASKNESKSQIEQQQNTLESQLQNLLELNHNLSQKVDDYEENLAQITSNQQKLEYELSGFINDTSILEESKKILNKSLNSDKSNKSDLEHENQKLNSRLKHIKNDLEEVENSSTKVTSMLKVHEATTEKFENEVKKLKEQIEETSKNLEQSKEREKTAKNISKQNTSEIQTLNSKKEDCKGLLTKYETESKMWLCKKDNFQREYDDLYDVYARLNNIKEQKEQLYRILEDLELQLNEVKQDKDDTRRSILNDMLHLHQEKYR